MGFNYRRRIRLSKGSWLNVSKRGVSLSSKAGPVTFNSRGRTTVNFGGGWSYVATGGGCGGFGCLIGLAVIYNLVTSPSFWLLVAVGCCVVGIVKSMGKGSKSPPSTALPSDVTDDPWRDRGA